MFLNNITRSSRILEKATEATWKRGEAIAQNLANIDTPGYKRKDVNFEAALASAMDSSDFHGLRTESGHIVIGAGSESQVTPVMTNDNNTASVRLDGNNVDIDRETALEAKNTLQYNTVVQRMNTEFKKLKYVISEGKR